MTYTVRIYYRKHGTSDMEHFEMPFNYCYGKGMPAQLRKPIPPIPPPKKEKAR